MALLESPWLSKFNLCLISLRLLGVFNVVRMVFEVVGVLQEAMAGYDSEPVIVKALVIFAKSK